MRVSKRSSVGKNPAWLFASERARREVAAREREDLREAVARGRGGRQVAQLRRDLEEGSHMGKRNICGQGEEIHNNHAKLHQMTHVLCFSEGFETISKVR